MLGTAVVAISLSLSCTRVPWAVSREVCGQVGVVNKGSSTILGNTELELYKARSKNVPCCSSADRIESMRTDVNGKFRSGRLEPGPYFVLVKSSDPKIAFPVLLEKGYDGQTCNLNAVFTFDQETRKTEQTITLYVNRSQN
jgi:hypothetical protein